MCDGRCRSLLASTTQTTRVHQQHNSAPDCKSVWHALQVLELVGDHQNIAALKCAFEDRDYVYFVLELCKGGELFDRIVAEVSLAGSTAEVATMEPA